MLSATVNGSALEAIRAELSEALAPRHLGFLTNELMPWATVGDYFFCHAGVRPGIPLDRQDPLDLMTIREPFLTSVQDHGKIIVHGHSPTQAPVVRSNRIGIDTGAYATGCLTCLVLEGDALRFIQT
jgi:serine/threonine protein phosphatase 1